MSQGPPRLENQLVETFHQQRSRLYGFLTRSLGAGEAIEDLLQEVFLRSWDHREDLEGGGRDGVRKYLWRVARNLVIDEIRTRVRQRSRGEEAQDLEQLGALPDRHNPGPAKRVQHEDCLRVVRETVGQLSNQRARQCLELWMRGSNLADIAGELGLQIGQVRGLLQRGKAEVLLRAGDRLRFRPATGAAS